VICAAPEGNLAGRFLRSEAHMSAEIIYGTDFKRSNPKVDTGVPFNGIIRYHFEDGSTLSAPIIDGRIEDTAPSEMNMDEGA